MKKIVLILILLFGLSCMNKDITGKRIKLIQQQENFIALLDTVWQTEQTPIRIGIL
ncbi:hypothetical protein [Aequorivita flava]|uniref:Uncharacterized protein n=1 Tax=Aequorivita flava TaxID=3114371 RepID=A0AB35YMY7_9FLAO